MKSKRVKINIFRNGRFATSGYLEGGAIVDADAPVDVYEAIEDAIEGQESDVQCGGYTWTWELDKDDE